MWVMRDEGGSSGGSKKCPGFGHMLQLEPTGFLDELECEKREAPRITLSLELPSTETRKSMGGTGLGRR